MDTLTNPPWLRTLKDIMRWKHHFGVTFFALYLFGYTCLLADVFMFPVLLVVFVIFVGLVGSCERHFHDRKLFVNSKAQMSKQVKVEEGNSKSMAERYYSGLLLLLLLCALINFIVPVMVARRVMSLMSRGAGTRA